MKIIQSDLFRRWADKLKDRQARGLIAARLFRLSEGHFGDARAVGEGVSEIRIHSGPGYRIYFHQRGNVIVILLCASDKSTRKHDIATAKNLLRDWNPE